MSEPCNKKIALVVKASNVGERALNKAIEITKKNNCKELDLLFIVDKDFFSGDSSGYVKPDYLVEKGLEGIGNAILDNMEIIMKKIAQDIVTKRIILHGETTKEITNFVKNNSIDILIIPKGKRGPIEKFITGADISSLIKEIKKYTKPVLIE